MFLLLFPFDPLIEEINAKHEPLADLANGVLQPVLMPLKKQMTNLPHGKRIFATIYNLAWRPIFEIAY
jgi:hypothetical protein